MARCPPPEQLEQLLTETLADTARASLEAHVEACPACQERLHRLSDSDRPIGVAAASSTEAAPDPPGRLSHQDEAVLERLKKARPSPSPRPEFADRPASGTGFPVIPGYEILQVLGYGAAGVVYKARQQALNRLVALKMIRGPEQTRPEDRLRFQIEGEVVARLHHPNIVQIYEVGNHAGQPFFAFEFVDGGSLADRLDGTPQPPRHAAELIETLARAVHAAHLQGIVHRDLKPSNILLATPHDPEGSSTDGRPKTAYGVPRIADFGLAKQLGQDVALTQSGLVLGTPRYMAPEQCLPESKQIGPATDVYALGSILYELLTGRVPFRSAELLQILRQVREDEPVPPRRWQPQLPRDLECICLKCLEKEPRQRYASAEALANDLHRFLDGEPIRARPVGALERTWKWTRRRPLVAALVLGLVGVISLALIGMTGALLYAVAGWDLASKQQHEAIAARNDAQLLSARLTLDRGIALADQGDVAGGLHFMCQALEMAPADATELRRLARINLAAWSGQIHGLRQILPHPDRTQAGVVSPNGQTLVTGGDDALLRRWDVATGRLLCTFPKARGLIQTVAFSPDGQTIVTAGGGVGDHRADVHCAIEFWDATTAQRLGDPWILEKQIWGIAFSPDGRRLASIGNEPCLRLWDRAGGGPPQILTPRTRNRAGVLLDSILFTGAGHLLAGGKDGVMRLWDPEAGQELRSWPAHAGSVRALALHPGGQFVASAGHDGRVRLWQLATGQAAGEMQERTPSSVAAVAFSPDGTLLFGACNDSHVRIWNVATGRLLGNRPQHQSLVSWLALAAGGRLIVTGGHDKTVRFWDVAHVLSRPADSGLGLSPPFGPSAPPRHSPGSLAQVPRPLVQRVDFSPDGQTALLLGDKGLAWLWDLGAARPRAAPLAHPYNRVRAAAFSPDGRLFATTCHQARTPDCVIRFWDAATGEPRSDWLAQPNWVAALAFSPDGKRLAAGDYADCVRLLDV
ncbi:MAG: protein kinase, partial [Gemmataceae bacterium]|nr:protein kinase [Gemmataceae bacterium]